MEEAQLPLQVVIEGIAHLISPRPMILFAKSMKSQASVPLT